MSFRKFLSIRTWKTRVSILFSVASTTSGAALAVELNRIEIQESQGLYSIYAEAYISADPDKIWSNLTNCAKARDFVPYLTSCRILNQDANLRWDIRENISAPPLSPSVRTVIRNEFGRREFSYRLISGDLKRSEGEWRVTPHIGGARVTYFAHFEPMTFVPNFFMMNAVRRNIDEMLTRLERLSRGPI